MADNKKSSPKPLPGGQITIKIPPEVAKILGNDLRIHIKDYFPKGIPIPERLLNAKDLKEMAKLGTLYFDPH